jgi:hypothetical protein
MSGDRVDGAAAVDGSERVRDLVRFGWVVAEIRGRVRVGSTDPAEPAGLEPGSRKDHALPLSGERSWHEQFFELIGVVGVLADKAGVDDLTTDDLRCTTPAHDGEPDRAARFVTEFAADAIDKPALWPAFAELMYCWDALIQDRLARGPFGEASAYQLGRGIGETTWALDASADTSDMAAWGFLLGQQRAEALRDLVLRLSPNFSPLTARAVAESLMRWQRVARSERWRSRPDALRLLRRQARVWRDLLVTNRDPADLIKPMAPVARGKVLIRLLKALWLQSLTFLFSVIVLGLGVLSLSRSGSSTSNLIPTVLGVVGVTGAALSAKIQSSAQSLLSTVKSEYRFSMIVDGITTTPDAPRGVGAENGLGVLERVNQYVERSDRRQLRRRHSLRVVRDSEEDLAPADLPDRVFGFEEIFAVEGLRDGRARLKGSVIAPDDHRRPLEVHKHDAEIMLTGYVSSYDAAKIDKPGPQWLTLWMRRSNDASILVEVPLNRTEAQSLGDGSVENGFRLYIHLTG